MNRDPFDFFNPAKFVEWQGQLRTANDLAEQIESQIQDVDSGRVIPDTFGMHAHYQHQSCGLCSASTTCFCAESIRR